MGDLLSYSFEGYLYVTRWNTSLDKEEERKILQITGLTQPVTSLEVLKKILVYMAKRPIPGRIVTMYWVVGGTKLLLLEKLAGIFFKEYQNEISEKGVHQNV